MCVCPTSSLAHKFPVYHDARQIPKLFITMRLATPCLFLALLGVSLVTGAELDRPRNLRRGLVSRERKL